MQNIEVVRTEANNLNRQVWRFWYFDREHTLRLDFWSRESRATLRHKFVQEAKYHTHTRGSSVPSDIPADVAVEAIEKFSEGLTVTVWK